jgi:hypothetical protein
MASGNSFGCLCFRILTVTCYEWSALVSWCLLPSAAIVTQLVPRSSASKSPAPSRRYYGWISRPAM